MSCFCNGGGGQGCNGESENACQFVHLRNFGSPIRREDFTGYSPLLWIFHWAIRNSAHLSHGENSFEGNDAFERPTRFFAMSNEHDFQDNAPGSAPEAPRYTSFSQAIDTARTDAKFKAREAAPKLKEALAGAAHDITYGAAFGACFAAAFAKELLPAGLREAIRHGVRDGRDAAAKTMQAASPSGTDGSEVPA
jgi:hypothetical protein